MKRPLKPYNKASTSRVGTWYEIKNLAPDIATVFIMDEIGEWGVTASDFTRELRDIKTSTIELHISSNGGSVFDGLAILNALRNHSATVNVVIDGIAASAASFIAMAGDTVKMSPNAVMMIHDAAAAMWGNADEMRAMADMLEKTSDNIAAIYAQRAGGTSEQWRNKMRAETWYNDSEAVAAGLADEIVGSPTNTSEVIVTAELENAPKAPAWGFDIANLIQETVK